MNKPTHWCLGWSGQLDLGFDDEKYLMRKHALMFYPEYFDENGEPRLDMLPIDTIEMAEERKKKREQARWEEIKKQRQAKMEKTWWYKIYRRICK